MKTLRVVTIITIAVNLLAPHAVDTFFTTLIVHAEETATSTPEIIPDPEEQARREQDQQRTELENQLTDLENQIAEHQRTIETYQKQGKTLKNDISSLNTKIDKLNLQIKAVNLTLSKVNREINNAQRQINRTENRIDDHKNALSKNLRNLYEADSKSIFEVLIANNRLSDFFNNLSNITLVQQNIRVALTDIVKLRQELLQQKEELALEKEDAENLRAIQQTQKKSVESTQKEKSDVLKATKGKESEYQKLLKKTQETAAQIRSRIFELLGGGELTFEKAYDYARLAEGATGVRAAMVLAVLHRESLLGKNTGRCSYQKAMNPKDIPTFLEILNKLNIDPESTVAKVSCPNADGRYGGAMGPAQFIPSTWKIFEASILQVTGSNPPNPWNNSDAFAATALYLKKYGADSKSTTAEKKAAAIYYCGSNWQRYACSYYAGKVVETAGKFQKDIDVLNSTNGA
ncbi:lytic murein transglycosylase [Candidatus Jorgensenbacteria bacterium]|nr:lytic murein transglycosylase [Candidatus Jorgensenbacteria bacterium]